MSDPRVRKLANLLANYCVQTRPGDKVILHGGDAAMPLLTETYREVLRAGGHPFLLWRDEGLNEVLLKEGSLEQITYTPPSLIQLYKDANALISIRGDRNTRALTAIDPGRYQQFQAARSVFQKMVMERSAANDFNWVTTIFPTDAYAQDADMSLAEYEDFVYEACYIDRDDPVAEWQNISSRQQKLVDWLAGKKEMVVKGPDVDLRLSIAGRSFINSDGRKNMPSGEIFTGPVEQSVNGWVRFSFPAIYAGREVEGIELRFEDGRVTDASAQKNEAFLLKMLDTDPGARYLGEFAVGTNDAIQRFTKSILFDEKIGGTIHMAVGKGYPETGSRNDSAVHWDMICNMRDGGQIWVDGELFYDSGRFLVLG